jgi:hypothetical protein
MLINRRTFSTRLGRWQDAVAVLKSGASHLDWVPPARVLTSHFGTFDRVELELEFESLAEYEKFWAAFDAAPETATVMAQWIETIEPGGTNEIWEIQ